MLKSKKGRKIIITVLTLIFLAVLGAVVNEVMAKFEDRNNAEVEAALTTDPIRKESKSVEGVKVETPKKIKNSEPFIVAIFGIDTRGEKNSRTDTIMLVRYDRENKDAQIVSIPRDSYVKIKGHGYDKINAAHAYGDLELAIDTIENLMDIKVDYYARADFKAFSDITEILGGVEVTVDKKMAGNGINIKAGTQVLEGTQLLDYVRFRKDSNGDFGRIERQQEVMIKLTDKILSFDSITKLPSIISTINDNVETNIDWKEFISLASDLKSMEDINIEQHTIETISDFRNEVWYEMIVEEDLEAKSALLNGFSLEEARSQEGYEFKSSNADVQSQSKLIKKMTEDGGHTYIKSTAEEVGMQEGFQLKTTSENWGF